MKNDTLERGNGKDVIKHDPSWVSLNVIDVFNHTVFAMTRKRLNGMGGWVTRHFTLVLLSGHTRSSFFFLSLSLPASVCLFLAHQPNTSPLFPTHCVPKKQI